MPREAPVTRAMREERARGMRNTFVMPGLKREARLRADVPGIHVFAAGFTDVDGRDKPGHDGFSADQPWTPPWSSPPPENMLSLLVPLFSRSGDTFVPCQSAKKTNPPNNKQQTMPMTACIRLRLAR